MAKPLGKLLKVPILRHNSESVLAREGPHTDILNDVALSVLHVRRVWEQVRKEPYQVV